jgi:signal peptidase I
LLHFNSIAYLLLVFLSATSSINIKKRKEIIIAILLFSSVFIVDKLRNEITARFIVYPTYIEGDSMSPVLKDGDRFYKYKLYGWFKDYKQGDIVSFSWDGQKFIKYIAADEGDKIIQDDDHVKIDTGDDVHEYNIYTIFDPPFEGQISGEYVLKDGEFFVLGINDSESFDSRYLGIIKEEQIIGKVIMRF